ncbi:alpha-ketoglutarate-dependent dioxygenase AlkB [Nostoc sp. UIC 10890]
MVLGTHDKRQIIEEPCEVKVSCTVLKTNGVGDNFVEFNHADNEASMGFNPAIASISLGSCRKFQIKPRNGKPTDFWLEHGSLLVMHPGCQSTHLHQVPKTNKVVGTRINLTFRPHTGGGR